MLHFAPEFTHVQDDIARTVVKLIAPKVRERELQRALRKHPDNITAYELVLQALQPLYRLEYANYEQARGLLQQAIGLDPSYAPAYAYAAWWHSGHIGQSWSLDPKHDAAEAVRLANAALELDSENALAITVRAHESAYLEKDFVSALQGFDDALALCPNLASAWTLQGLTQCFIGDGKEALECAKTGVHLSPVDQNLSFAEHVVGQSHSVNGEHMQAAVWCRRAFEKNPSQGSNLRTLISSLVLLGDLAEARKLAIQHISIAPQFRTGAWAERSPMNGAIIKERIETLCAAGVPM